MAVHEAAAALFHLYTTINLAIQYSLNPHVVSLDLPQ